jgi:rSAM/selenodomain-associated transferase 1
MVMNPCLAVFAKLPRPGEVKTRLCPPLSPRRAAALATAFLRDTLLLAEQLAGWERVLAYAPWDARQAMAALAPGWRLLAQQGPDLGARLDCAIGRLFARGADRVIVIGSDSPQLPPARFEEAAAALQRSDAVLGPTEDGGFHLLGLRRWQTGMLAGVRWSTEHAAADTLARLGGLGLTSELLPPDCDVDDIDGLVRLAGDLTALPPTQAPNTRAMMTALRKAWRP